MDIQIIKRDGTKEPYDEEKIIRVVKAAGLDDEKSIELAHAVTQKLQGTNIEDVTSIRIRDIVLEELKIMDQYAANLFEWYQKTKG